MSKFIYVMESSKSLYKIGVSSDPTQRLKSVQTGSGDRVSLIFTYFTNEPFYHEKLIHRKFSDNQVIGEWFKFKDKGFIKELVDILIGDAIEIRAVSKEKKSLGFVADFIEKRCILKVRDVPRPNGESDPLIARELKDLGCTKRTLKIGQYWVTPLGASQNISTNGPKKFVEIYKSQTDG